MSKFAFSLEPVLQVKSAKEQAVLQELAAADAALQACRENLAKLKEMLANVQESGVNLSDIVAMVDFEAYRNLLDARISQAERELRESLQEADSKRSEAFAVMKERLVLESLKQKQQNAFEREVTRKTNREMDALATISYSIKKGGI